MKHLFKKGHKHSEETKRKISEARKNNNYLKGKKGILSPSWKGGEFIFQGYIMLYNPAHKGSNKKGYIKRANLVWYENMKEIIKPPYFLHHINGIKTDDRIENLQKVTRSEHMKLEHKNHDYCKIRGKKFKKGIGILGNERNFKTIKREMKTLKIIGE